MSKPAPTDRLPKTFLTPDEVIDMLRLDYSVKSGTASRETGLRRLKTLREKRRIPFHQLGHKTIIYPRAGIERFKKQTLVEAK